METSSTNYLSTTLKLFKYYKSLGDAVIKQLDAAALNWQYNPASNSVATIVKHISGNSISRWTDSLTSDGEKPTRDRDAEFEDTYMNKSELIELWEQGWTCLFGAIEPLTAEDLMRTIYIRNEGHTALEAINRQLAHLPYHIGQMVFIGKMIQGEEWKSLTIPKGQSNTYNKDKFAGDRKQGFFTDGLEKK